MLDNKRVMCYNELWRDMLAPRISVATPRHHGDSMGTTEFTHYTPGTDVKACFRAAKAEARDERGHQQGYSGDIQTKARVVVRHPTALTHAAADTLLYGANNHDGDLEQATRDGPCFAVPICADGGTATIGFLFYGQAPC